MVALEDGSESSLFDYTLDRRLIEVLHQEGDRVFVRGDLDSGERVVIEGLQRVLPGQRVTEGTIESLAQN